MKDNQNKYLGKVISLLVRDTRIDNSIILPYLKFAFPTSFLSPIRHLKNLNPSAFFVKYCENTYGLSYDEIKYVWDQYRGIIKDKIDNGK